MYRGLSFLVLAVAACSEPDSGFGSEPVVAEWATLVGGTGYQEALSVAIGPDDSIAVAGIFTHALPATETGLTGDGSIDGFVALFDAAGTPIWSRALSGAEDDGLTGVSFVGDAIVVSGYAGRSALLADQAVAGTADSSALVARFAADGTLEWQRTFGGDGFQSASALRPTSRGTVVVAGTFTSTLELDSTITASGPADAFVAELDRDGALLWARPITGPGSEVLQAVTVAEGGSIAVSGTSQLVADPSVPSAQAAHVNSFVLGLAADGSESWSKDRLFSDAHQHGGHMMIDKPELLSQGADGEVLLGVTRGAMFALHGEDFEAPSFDTATVLSLDGTGELRWQSELGKGTTMIRLANAVGELPVERVVGSFSGELEFGEVRLRGERPRSLFVAPLLEGGGFAAPRPVFVDSVSAEAALTAIASSTLSDGSTIVIATVAQPDDDRDLVLLRLPPPR